jgi:predicted nucleotidyltransferase component of viral defense system
VALQDRARNEPRDLYDLWFLTTRARILKSAILLNPSRELRFREKEIAGLKDRIVAKEMRLKTLWNSRLGHQVEALPQFDEVFRTVRRELRQANFPRFRG